MGLSSRWLRPMGIWHKIRLKSLHKVTRSDSFERTGDYARLRNPMVLLVPVWNISGINPVIQQELFTIDPDSNGLRFTQISSFQGKSVPGQRPFPRPHGRFPGGALDMQSAVGEKIKRDTVCPGFPPISCRG